MKLKDIVNRDNVTLTNCEHEPIHIPGSIQAHGFLLAVNATTFDIKFCSGNVSSYINLSPSEVLQKNIQELVGDTIFELLQTAASKSEISMHPHILILNNNQFSVLFHRSGNFIILECEPEFESNEPLANIYDQTSRFLGYLHQTSTLQELCEMAAKGTREITGYDRVMIYRFDKDYNGEIIAEDVRDDLEPFLGLHYPHTDIPVQARELYLKNVLRLIYDVNYEPVPIFTQESNVETYLDLSHSILRSTSPIHVQYLHNMGVGATLTISLIHQGKLWGLIACHHYSPKNLSHKVRLAAQLQGHFITSQIDIRQLNAEYEISKTVNKALESLTSITLTADESDFNKIINSADILEICNAKGAVILYNNHIYKTGLVPSDVDILNIATKISQHSGNKGFHTDTLKVLVPDLSTLCEIISGVLYHELETEGPNCILWFRPESLSEIHWAGDPSKAILKDEKGLSPRNSFKLYSETVKCISKPWLQPELNASANFAHILQKHVNFLSLSREESKFRKLSEILKETNLELENINWISTHDLQEPLRKMQIVSSKMLFKENSNLSPDVINSLTRINGSARKMQNLLIDILAFTRINQDEDIADDIDLNVVLSKVIAELKLQIAESNAVINVENLPIIKGSLTLLQQVFTHILSNSLQFTQSSIQPQINISCEILYTTKHNELENNQKYNILVIRDNGIGFDPQFQTSIFNVFTKLNAAGENSNVGSGIGLAICKKIMQIHGGLITAESELNKGATFKLYFPA